MRKVPAVTTGLPSGDVTFVFTDIEGSTRLLRRSRARYAVTLDRHYALLRRAWGRHGGHEVDTAGDGMFIAFADAPDAVEACAEGQRLLGAERWPGDQSVRVRMGIHTGPAWPRNNTYVALAVHQAQRVMSAAHGGQVLISDDTVQRVPPFANIEVVPVGRFRVRDFDEPVGLCTLAGPGLASEFPAVRAVPADGHNLVGPPTSFVGRSIEVSKIAELLGPRQLVTLTGPGGVGKTRLATEVGLRVVPAWADGVWLVDLAPVQEVAQIGSTVASAVGLPPSGDDRWDDVTQYLRQRHALVVLDNCDQVAEACGQAADELLAACQGCGVLATSRAPLGVRRELVFRVGTLAVSDAAVDLFVDRARPLRPELVLDHSTAPTIAAICNKVDGLPLAIELAAARLGVLSLTEILDGLDDRFRLLRTHNTDVPARQQTMEGLLEWSDRLLSDQERACLRRLGVFGASFSVRAADAVVAAGGIDTYDVPELVWSLVDKSLVAADLTANDTRYRLLEPVRAFARRQMSHHGEAEATAVRLARWFLERIGLRQRDRGWTGETGVELDNLRALVPLLTPVESELAQEVAVTIGRYLEAVQAYRDGIEELTRYADDLVAPTSTRISLLTCLADLRLRTGEVQAAERLVAAAEAVRNKVGAVPTWDDVGIERIRADLACRIGDYDGAVNVARGALRRELSVRGRARMHSQLGIASSLAGDIVTARDALEQELAAYELLEDDVFAASAHGNLAELAIRAGDVRAAAGHQRACLTLALALGAPVMVAFSLIVAARIKGADDWTTATSLHSHAESLLETTGLALYDDDRRVSEAMVEAARQQLGEQAFAEASRAGRDLDLPAVAAIADGVLSSAAQG